MALVEVLRVVYFRTTDLIHIKVIAIFIKTKKQYFTR